jgi:hypothetical protein
MNQGLIDKILFTDRHFRISSPFFRGKVLEEIERAGGILDMLDYHGL